LRSGSQHGIFLATSYCRLGLPGFPTCC
jgi:hypothetical protein